MYPIQHFLEFNEAAGRLQHERASFHTKVHYAKQLIESAHTIVTKGYDKTLEDIFRDEMEGRISTLRRKQFETFSEIRLLSLLPMPNIAQKHTELHFLTQLDSWLNEADTTGKKSLATEFEDRTEMQELFRDIRFNIKTVPTKVDLGYVVQLVRRYYRSKSILFMQKSSLQSHLT